MIGRSDYRRAAQQCFYVCGPADDSDFVADVITDVQEAGLANARLIAAAPDLLEACEAFLEKWQRQGLDANLQLEKFDTLAKVALWVAPPNLATDGEIQAEGLT
jgi:hypothetical protein